MAWQPYDHGDSVQYTGPNLFQWNQAITSSSTTNIWKVQELHKFSLFFQHPGSLSHPGFLCFLSLLWHCFFFSLCTFFNPSPIPKQWKARSQEDSQLERLCPLPLNPHFKNYRRPNEDRYYEPENDHPGESALLVVGEGRSFGKILVYSCCFQYHFERMLSLPTPDQGVLTQQGARLSAMCPVRERATEHRCQTFLCFLSRPQAVRLIG